MVRDLEVQIDNALVPVDFHVLDIKLNWNSSLLLGREFLSAAGAVCNKQTNQLCLTLIDPPVHYDPIPFIKPQTSSRRSDDPGLIAACHCWLEYETEYSTSIETHTTTSIDITNQKSIDNHIEESIDSGPDDWENDYYNPTLAEHSARPSTRATPHRKKIDEDYEEERATVYKASTDIAYYPSINDGVDRAQEGNYSIGSWADDNYHESYAVETSIHEPGEDEPHEGFKTEELLNHRERLDTDSLFTEACGRGTRFYCPFTRANRPSIDTRVPPSIDIRSQPPLTVREKAKQNNNYLTPDGFGIFRDLDGYAKSVDGHALQRNIPEHQQRVANEFYNTDGEVDDHFKPKYRQHTRPSIDIGDPTSIDRRLEFGRRAYDRDGTRRFH
ncbi:hypothetical protein DY000_02015451 [Brassica cretica]|uniref:Uncharacterized protein n=1 Tax=Brassica cretica TaxID=69181 RepID=A0ABQ7CWJ1_BRACR|nr:hypothetical protein DY000_02015451 [Brassica cretica]